MTSNKKADFSRRFGDLLEKERVPGKARGYYVRHLERWGAAYRQRPAEMERKDFLEGYLRKLVHTAGVEPFVVSQTVEAVRLARLRCATPWQALFRNGALRKPRPEWLLRYCSKAAALVLSRNAVAISICQGI